MRVALVKWVSMVCDRSFPPGMRPSCQSVRTFWRWADLRKRSSWRQEDTSGWARAQKTSTGVDGGGVDMLGSSSHMDGWVYLKYSRVRVGVQGGFHYALFVPILV